LGAGTAQIGSVTVSSLGAGVAQIGSATVSNLNLGTDDSALAATPPFYPVGGEYRASSTTYTDGDGTVMQTDINGNVKQTLATAIAGEDLTNDVMKTEQRFSYALYSGASITNTVKSGAGFLHLINIGSISMPTISLYDNTAASGAMIQTFPASIPVGSYLLDVSFATGLTIITTSGVNQNIMVAYR
jgi:hypothetical protein